jgi:hypothetical protein
MLNLLVVGGFDSESENADDINSFGKVLGSEIIRQGHVLVNSCRTEFDRIVAEGAHEEIERGGKDEKTWILSYIMKNQTPIHTYGTVRQSRLVDWELGSPGLTIPEPITLADTDDTSRWLPRHPPRS